MRRTIILYVTLLLILALSKQTRSSEEPDQGKAKGGPDSSRSFRAGAYAVDVSPLSFPVLVNGGFLQSQATSIKDPIRAKCIVLDDGSTRLAIVVVDTCMMPRELIDRAKSLAREKTGIRSDRMLVSATHTHSAPAAMGALGCPADLNYMRILPGLIAESIEHAARNLEPARIGWARSTIMCIPTAGGSSVARTGCLTIRSDSEPFGPTCTRVIRVLM